MADTGFSRGKSGVGAGGGGKSFGVGAIEGNQTGGGRGAGDFGLKESKGREITIEERDLYLLQDGLDPDVIAARIRKYLPQIQACYEEGLRRSPALLGTVHVAFVIQGNGSVKDQTVTESSLNHKATEACMMEKIGGWEFPKPRGGGTVGVNYPFMLMSNNNKE